MTYHPDDARVAYLKARTRIIQRQGKGRADVPAQVQATIDRIRRANGQAPVYTKDKAA